MSIVQRARGGERRREEQREKQRERRNKHRNSNNQAHECPISYLTFPTPNPNLTHLACPGNGSPGP
jgi:hypothetical protein